MSKDKPELEKIEKLLTAKEWLKLAEEVDNREQYKTRIGRHIAGAMREFYKAQCAEKNDLPGVTGWRKEVSQHLGALYDAIIQPIRGFDSIRLAIDEVIIHFKSRDANARARAESTILTDFPELEKLSVHFDETDSELFWKVAIEGTIAQAFADFDLH